MQARIFNSRRLYAALAAGITAVATGLILGGTGPAFAQLPTGTKGFLTLVDQNGPIQGDVRTRAEEGAIALKGYNFSFHNSGTDLCSPLTIRIGYDSSWPVLTQDAVNYSPMQKVQLDLRNRDSVLYHQYKLNNAYLNQAVQEDSDSETLSFSASSVTEKTWPVKPSGLVGKPITREISCAIT